MPRISIDSAGGPLSVEYTISTPKNVCAETIDSTLPTIIFLHPVHLSQAAFHHQFADPHLRRAFNLIAFDLRAHGHSAGGVKESWCVAEAVDDVVKFIDALHLPAVHLVGVNLGSLIALELAAVSPQHVLSMCLISPPAMDEIPAVAEGRHEIHRYWEMAYEKGGQPDEAALYDAVAGCVQLGSSNAHVSSSFVTALVHIGFTNALRNFSPPNLRPCELTTVRIFTDRKHPTLRGISCPVLLLYCSEDVVYPLSQTEALQCALLDVGVKDVRLQVLQGAGYFWGRSHQSEEVNPLIHDLVVQSSSSSAAPESPDASPVVSPFYETFVEAGWRVDEDEDEDTDQY
ncbi:Alpha/Beta hydrolase protein [Roridomyces roridus]|uniref:Alpha/Beta hydrolase protein n=1 Tax=Roridomyces roridus TaxID=1738132 RepID=A0AAD7FPY5_9AGAR|nr:Alpha/Beta hydrolase protein [Roridomyces roridus]